MGLSRNRKDKAHGWSIGGAKGNQRNNRHQVFFSWPEKAFYNNCRLPWYIYVRNESTGQSLSQWWRNRWVHSKRSTTTQGTHAADWNASAESLSAHRLNLAIHYYIGIFFSSGWLKFHIVIILFKVSSFDEIADGLTSSVSSARSATGRKTGRTQGSLDNPLEKIIFPKELQCSSFSRIEIK